MNFWRLPLPTWLIGLIGTLVGLVLMALALWPLMGFGARQPAAGWLTAMLPWWTGFMMLAAIIVPAWLIPWLRMRSDARLAQLNESRHALELQALAADPQRACWVPLAQRHGRAEAEMIDIWDARYRALLADPRRRHHALACLDGRFPSDAEIDYQDDPGARVCCGHLVPVESALKTGNYHCALLTSPRAMCAEARIDDLAVLRRAYPLDQCVHFSSNLGEAFSANDRGPHEIEEQRLCCARCDSFIRFDMGPPFPPPPATPRDPAKRHSESAP